MFYECIESSVLRNDVEETRWVTLRQQPKIISNMKIKCICARGFHGHIFTSLTEFLDGNNKVDREFCIVWSQKNNHSKMFAFEQGK